MRRSHPMIRSLFNSAVKHFEIKQNVPLYNSEFPFIKCFLLQPTSTCITDPVPMVTPLPIVVTLEFWSSSAIFSVFNDRVLLFENNERLVNDICLCIYDASARHCGITRCLDPTWLLGLSERSFYECVLLSRIKEIAPQYARRGKRISINSRDDLLRYNSISKIDDMNSRTPNPDIHWPPRGTVTEFDQQAFESKEWYMLNVMLIQRKGEFAERVALGQIHKDAWAKADSQRKFFRLI